MSSAMPSVRLARMVLTVTTSAERVASMLDALRTLTNGKVGFASRRVRCCEAASGFDTIRSMTNMTKEAIAVLRELPEDRQETIALAILDFASHDDDVYHLTDDERREVRAGLAENDQGEFATEREVQAVYKRLGV
jgi:hypothetical protein